MIILSLTTPPPLPFPNTTQSKSLTSFNLNPHSLTLQKFICYSTRKPKKPNKKFSDAELSSELAAEVQKMNTQLQEKENALKKSKQILFSDLCKFLNDEPNEVKAKWVKMNPDEKLCLVDGFVSDWGLNFHPLSKKSVRDLVEEFVIEDNNAVDVMDKSEAVKKENYSAVFLPSLRKLIMGSSPDN